MRNIRMKVNTDFITNILKYALLKINVFGAQNQMDIVQPKLKMTFEEVKLKFFERLLKLQYQDQKFQLLQF